MLRTRKPAQAGRFYPGDHDELQSIINEYMKTAADKLASSLEGVRPVGLVCPHAGYIYSAQTAAFAYAAANGFSYSRALIAAPSHYEFFHGATFFDGELYETPLGATSVDREFCERLAQRSPLAARSASADIMEHSLEVQVPFMQTLLKEEARLAPLLLGRISSKEIEQLAREIYETLSELDGENANRSTLLIASTDLYHGNDEKECLRQSEEFVQAVEAFDADAFDMGISGRKFSACGSVAVSLVMRLAQFMGAQSAKVLRTSTSADVHRSIDGRIVGYAAAMFA